MFSGVFPVLFGTCDVLIVYSESFCFLVITLILFGWFGWVLRFVGLEFGVEFDVSWVCGFEIFVFCGWIFADRG